MKTRESAGAAAHTNTLTKTPADRPSVLREYLIVAAGGALGAPARKLVGLWSGNWLPFPYSTFIINVSGSLLLGLTLGFLSNRLTRSRIWRLGIAIGFIGAYTTFSSFEYEALKLIQSGHPWQAVIYLVSSVCVGFAAVWGGNLAGRRL